MTENPPHERMIKVKRNMKFGVEIEFFGITRRAAHDALARAGLSVEVEDYNHVRRGWWKLTTDGSVNRDGCHNDRGGGNELVSPPLLGKEGLEELKLACKVLQEAGAKVDRTCGIHVHHDASGLDVRAIKNIYKLYKKFEHAIDYMMPKSRRDNNNQYCGSVTDNEMAGIERATCINDIVHLCWDRYRKVNIQSYPRHGTIEFRQHSGSTDAEKIANWVLITHKIVEKAWTDTDVEVAKNWRHCDSNWWFRQLVGKGLEKYVVERMNYWHEKERAERH